MSGNSTTHLSRSYDLAAKVSRLLQTRTKLAHERYTARMQKSCAEHVTPLLTRPWNPWDVWTGAARYAVDAAQRWVLFWDALRQRGNAFVEHTRAGLPPVLRFAYEMVLDARTFERPVNYALVRITPPPGVTVDPKRRPYVIIDPRAGHGPGIGGFKDDSQVGVALAAGHPVYFVIFFPEPEAGQTMYDVCAAEQRFVREVRALHPESPKPVIVGNCQGGWAAMMLASASPEDSGPIVINGAPMSYWGGAWREGEGDNPMRYAGGLLGGTWLASLTADLGHGKFDGAWLVQNFENLNPANTFWDKYYHLYANVDTEPPRFLEFERWWGGFYLMNREEIEWITRNLFVGNKLWSGDVHPQHGKGFDLREVRSPIVLFASMGDNITPPQQAFNWVADVYGSTEEIKARGQVIVGLLHQDIGHLGIFVSGKVAKKEHAQIVSVMDSIEALPAGLYGMQILESRGADGRVQYDVQFVEHRLEEVAQRLNRFKRADEKPFDAVEEISEFNQRAYELFAQPAVQAVSSEPMAKLGRAFHPLRFQRWAVSDYYNPWLWWLGPMAEAIRAQRKTGSTGEATRTLVEQNPWLQWLKSLAGAARTTTTAGGADPGAMLRTMTETNPWLWWLRPLTEATRPQSARSGDTGAAMRMMIENNPWSQWLRSLTDVVKAQPAAVADPLAMLRTMADANPWLQWLRPAADAAMGQAAAVPDPTAMLRTMAEANPWFWWLRSLTDVVKAQPVAVADPVAMLRMMSDANPWLQWLRPAADAARPQPPGTGDDDAARRVERMMAEATSAALDYYRDMRDAVSEAAFFLTYGNLFSFYLADRHEAAERKLATTAVGDPRNLPFVKEALGSMEQGGYAEAAARAVALINRGDQRIPLSRLEFRRDMAKEYAEFLPAIPLEQMRRIRGEQDIIVRYEPERALETLPKLLADPADRDRLLALIKRLLADERMRSRNLTAEDLARIDAILAVLGAPPRRPLTTVPRSA